MNKICFFTICFLLFVGIAWAEMDMSGDFSFTPPEGWVVNNLLPHSILTYKSKDDHTHTIIIADEFRKGPLSEIKKTLEENMKENRSYRSSRIISSNIIKLKNGKKAIRIINEIAFHSIDVIFRQVIYVVTLKSGKKISIICMVRKKDEDLYDRMFDNFVNSIN